MGRATFSDTDRSNSRERPRLTGRLPSQREEFAVNRSAWQPLSLRSKATTRKKGSWNSEPISELQSKSLPAY